MTKVFLLFFLMQDFETDPWSRLEQDSITVVCELEDALDFRLVCSE